MARWNGRKSGTDGRRRREAAPSPGEEVRLRAILDAALHAFARQGYAQTPVAEVAAAAKVASGTVIYHFQTKENLLSILVWECLRLLYRRCADAVAAAAPGPARVWAYVEAYFDYLAEEPDRILLLLKTRPLELSDAAPAPGLDILTLWQSCRRLLEDACRELPAGSAGGPEALAATLFAQLSGAAWLHLFFREDLGRMRSSALDTARSLCPASGKP